MRQYIAKMVRRTVVGSALMAVSLLAAPLMVHAATPDTLYSYDFTGATLASPIANAASANSSVKLNLYGSWSQSAFGIHFAGNQSGQQSVAYAKPASGNTLSVASNQALGSAIKFKYEAPTSGTCFSDSHNLTQIGRFGAGLAQVKMQFSNCGINSSQVMVQCRMAGANSTINDVPMTSTQPLVNGEAYVATCTKAPDPTTGSATMQLAVTRLSDAQATTDTFAITRTGAITSTAYLSVGNKYALPPPTENTDQFNGDVAKVAYCASTTTVAVDSCLHTEIPVGTNPVPTPTLHEFVGNSSLETDLTGWAGLYSTTSKNTRVSGGYDGAYSLRSVNNSSATGANGFIDKPTWLDGTANKATVAGTTYTGSVWVKPDVAGQKINLYLRERNVAGTTINSKTVTVTTATTNWVQIVNAYTAQQTGDNVGFYVYGSNITAGKGFNADKLSLNALY
jgi:hypothetical protein